jgi:hypothetical protein
VGASKKTRDDIEAATETATMIAVASGVLRRCPFHGTVFNASVAAPDYDKAYKLGTAMLTKRTISVGSRMSRLGFLQLIQKVIDHAAMGCWECSKREAE